VSGSSFKIPPQTNIKANKVPILVRSVTSDKFIKREGIATTNPVKRVEKEGVRYFG